MYPLSWVGKRVSKTVTASDGSKKDLYKIVNGEVKWAYLCDEMDGWAYRREEKLCLLGYGSLADFLCNMNSPPAFSLQTSDLEFLQN